MLKVVIVLVCSVAVTNLAQAADPAPGECASGFCGTPNNNGGGGCGCGGGSILVNNTDFGVTYSTSDDYDADGFEDDSDNCPFISNRDQADSDGDGVGNACDNAPNAPNPDQKDTDGDGIGDVADDDIDGDTIPNATDNCPLVRNVSQKDSDGKNGGDACDPAGIPPGDTTDSDADHIPDVRDNCLEAANTDQADQDGDKIGDACDFDVDGDGLLNSQDNCVRVANPTQTDTDHDGVGDACDPNPACFVAAKNQAAACLDPKSAFQVTAGPSVLANTGGETFLAFYANRESTSIRYTFTLTERPANSVAVISNPRGTAQVSQAFEYRFADEAHRPKFTPDQPGEYKIGLTAELVAADTMFPESVTAESSAAVTVSGASTSKGCNAAGGATLAWLAGAALMAARRLRRRD